MEKIDEVLRRRMRAMWVTGISTLTLGTTCIPNVAFATNDNSNSGSDDSATTGIQASLLSSMAAKKDSAGLVDVISAEDIGRFPDSNLATAMARLPGVTASHESSIGFTSTGDATSITVRGFGPTFNTTLADGRQLASATGTRAYDFSTIGTESVKAVHVLKTPDTTLSSGAIGATINIINRLPFDESGLQLNGSVAGTYATGEEKTTPNGAILFSDTFADNTFGVLADVSYTQARTKGDHTNIDGWTGAYLNCSQFATLPSTCAGIYDTAPSSWYMQDYNTYEEHNDDKRTSGRLALQWRPIENLLFTVNDDYSKDTLSQHVHGYSSWFSGGGLTDVVRNDNGTIISFIDPSSSPVPVDTNNSREVRNNDVGANVRWDATAHQSYLVDYSSSVSELRPTYSALMTSLGSAPVTQVGSVLNKDTVNDFKLQGIWKGDELKIDYGVQYSTNSEHLNNLNYCCFQSPDDPITVTIIPFQVIDEHTGSFFLNGLWKVSLGSTRLSVNAGIREERTKVMSEAFNQQLPTALTVQATDPTALLVSYTTPMPFSQDNRYNYLLPNLDLNFNMTDVLTLHVDVSRTLTRPSLSLINPDINVSPNQRVGALTASGGNPGLLPYLSYNRDVGLDWYYAKNSYVSVDVFAKNISNAPLRGYVTGTINNVIDPTTHQPAQFNILTQMNGLSYRVSGIELSLQHLFGDSGFGLMANATFLGDDKHYNRDDISNPGLPILGLTNSWNVVGFYDKYGLQFRIAVNHQDDALTSLGQEVNDSAFGLEPTYTNAATQVDARTSYEFNQHLSVYLDGQNLNNARYRTHGRFPEQLLNDVETGRRFTAGICLKL